MNMSEDKKSKFSDFEDKRTTQRLYTDNKDYTFILKFLFKYLKTKKELND